MPRYSSPSPNRHVRRGLVTSVFTLIALSASACEDAQRGSPLEVQAPVAEARYSKLDIRKVSGDRQAGPAQAVLPELLVVRVSNPGGNPQSDVALRWETEHRDASIEVLDPVTRADGTSRARLTLGASGQERVLVRTPAGSAQIFSFTATEAAAVAEVRVSDATLGLDAVGATAQLTASAHDARGALMSAEALTWMSLDPEVATVDDKGLVSALANGTARIVVRATCCAPADTASVRVEQVATAMTVSPEALQLAEGQGALLTATLSDANGNAIPGATPQWTSAAGQVASVTVEGNVFGLSAGSTVVTATAGAVSTQVPVIVEATEAEPTGTPAQVLDLTVVARSDDAVTLRWTGVDDGTGQPARYSIRSASPALSWGDASAGAQYITGTKLGGAEQFVWSGLAAGTTYEFQLVSFRRNEDGTNVYAPLSNKVSAATGSLAVAEVRASRSTALLAALGATVQLSASALDASGNAMPTVLAWSSLDPGIARVSSAGLVTAAGRGMARIVVGAGAAADTVTVTVDQEPSRVVVSPSDLSLADGATSTLSAAVLDANGYAIGGESVSWRVMDASIASVDANGRVTGMGAGTTSVRATSGLLQGAASVTVQAPSAPEDGGADDGADNGSTGSAGDPAFAEYWDFASTQELFAQPRSRFEFPIWANTGGFLELADTLRNTPWGGSKAIRTHWGGGPYNVHNDEQIGLNVEIPGSIQAEEVWIEIYLRYSDNFRVESDHKTMFVFEEDGTRWEMRFGAYGIRAQAKIDNGNVEVAKDANGREIDITNPELVWDGEWHQLRLHLRTGSNGVFESWLDGRKLIDTRFSPGSASPFRTIALGRNGDPVDPSELFWGPVQLYTQNPGW